MKLWHDDNRFPPADEWEWAKDNATAMEYLATGTVDFISIDMDLGAVEGKDFNYGRELGPCYRGQPWRSVDWLRNMNNDPGENGLDLAKWMIAEGCIPPRIVIHTWNYWGADAIIKCFAEAGVTHAEREFWNADANHLKRVYGSAPAEPGDSQGSLR